MSSRASQWPCPQQPTTASTRWRLVKSTTAHGHRRRTGPRLRTKLHGDRRKEPARWPELFKLFEEEPRGLRPEAFVELRPQERVQRHVVEHLTDLVRVAPMVQISRCTCAAEVDNLMDIFRLLDRGRAGCRSAQDLLFILSFPRDSSRAADGGTCGGSADDSLFPQADR